MRRFPILLTLAATAAFVPVSALAASEPPPTSEPASADDFVIQITYEGGLVPQEIAFVNTPALVVTADGRVVTTGPVPEIYPGPLVANLVQRTITDEGVQAYLDLAQELGLFEGRSYEHNPLVTDAASTVVRIRVGDEEFVNAAYALGFDHETDPNRADLWEFVQAALDPETVAGTDGLGEEEPFETDSFLVMAYVSDPGDAGGDVEPTVVDWPAETSVRLAEATTCAEVPYDEVADVLTEATQLTWFEDDGVTYRVAATPRLPGRTC